MTTKKVEQVDGEIGALKAKIHQWQQEHAAKTAYIATQEERRAELRHRALRQGDAQAAVELDDIRKSISTAHMELADIEAEAKDAATEIEQLMVEREEAQNREVQRELVAAYTEMESYIVENPEPLSTTFCRERWIPFCKFVQDRRARLRLNPEVPDHLPIKFYQGNFFGLFPNYVTKPPQHYMNKSFLELLREHRTKFTGEKSESATTERQLGAEAAEVEHQQAAN